MVDKVIEGLPSGEPAELEKNFQAITANPVATQIAAPSAQPQPEGVSSEPINVMSPDGELGSIPGHQLHDALSSGYQVATDDQVNHYEKQQKYGSTGQQLLTGLEGAGVGGTFGVSTAAEKALRSIGVPGLSDEDIQGRREANPISHGIGEAAGLAGSAFIPGVGEANLLEHAGQYAAAKVLGKGGAEAATLMNKIGAKTLSEATQMALMQTGDEVSKMITNDPGQTAGSAIADIGLSGLMGGAFGAAIGSVSPLWEATLGNKAGQMIEDFKGRMKWHAETPDPVQAVHDELHAHYNGVKEAADEVYGAKGLKSQEVARLMPEMNEKIAAQSTELLDKASAMVNKMKAEPELYSPGLVRDIEQSVVKAQEKLAPQNTASQFLMGIKPTEAPALDHFTELNDLKQKLQGLSKFERRVIPGTPEAKVISEIKGLGYELRTALEDPKVWGKAAERQQAINKAFSKYLPTLKDFEKKFTVEVNGERQIDPGKVNTYLNQLGKPNAEVKQQMLDNFLKASEDYKKVISATHANLGLENPISHSPLNVTKGTLSKPTPGAQLADYFVKKGIANLAGESAGTAIGAGLGSAFGHPGIGAIVGERALGPLLSSIMPAIAKPIMEKAANSRAFKATVDYATAASKGNAMATKAIKNIFKSGVNSVIHQPSERDRKRLEKIVDEVQTNPNRMVAVGNDIAHYLPNHGASIAQTSMNAINFLNSQKPGNDRVSPLDTKIPPSAAQQAQYNRLLDLAEQPLLVLGKIKAGSITPTEINAIKSMYPDLYSGLVSKISTETIEAIHKGEQVPYRTRMGISLFTGQPLDSTMLPASILAAQPVPKEPNPQQSQQPSKVPPQSATKNLSKLASSYQTPAQASEQRKMKNA